MIFYNDDNLRSVYMYIYEDLHKKEVTFLFTEITYIVTRHIIICAYISSDE